MRNELVIAIIVAVILAFIGGAIQGENQAKDRAAQTECARFSPDTGGFEWLDKRGDTK